MRVAGCPAGCFYPTTLPPTGNAPLTRQGGSWKMAGMDIRFQCPSCSAEITAKPQYAGAKFPCPTCGQRLQVPPPRNRTVLGEPLEPSENPLRLSPRPAPRGKSLSESLQDIAKGLVSLILIVFIVGACAICAIPALRNQPQSDVVNLANYNEIKLGMTYQQIVWVMVADGRETSRQVVEGELLQGFVWQNPDGSGMACTFRNGVLVGKDQKGLR